VGFIQFIISFLKDPRTQIAAWIAALGPVLVYCPLFSWCSSKPASCSSRSCRAIRCCSPVVFSRRKVGGLNLFATLIVFYAAAILATRPILDRALFREAHHRQRQGEVAHARAHGQARRVLRKYGGLTIVITRFMPFFRTLHRSLREWGHMNFANSRCSTSIGGISWVSLFVLVGYFFGGVPFVQQHFSSIVVGYCRDIGTASHLRRGEGRS
jgi:membrane-associated protein